MSLANALGISPSFYPDEVALGIPSWVLHPGGNYATLDIDFVNNRAYNSAGALTTPSIASLLTCSRASSGYYTNADGTLTNFGNNVLRYGTNGLLVEGGRTNIVLQSSTIGVAPWVQNMGSPTTSLVTGPDGVANSATQISSATNGANYYQGVTCLPSTTYTISKIVKTISGSTQQIVGSDSTVFGGGANTLAGYATFNTSTLVWDDVQAGVSNKGYQALANGWFLIWAVVTTNSSTTFFNLVEYAAGGIASTRDVFGHQCEAGSFPTSTIITTSLSATRAADVVSFSTTSWLSLTSGTFYANCLAEAGYTFGGDIIGGGANSNEVVQMTANNFVGTYNGTTVLSALTGSSLWSTIAKGAIGYDATHSRVACMGNGTVQSDANTLAITTPIYIGCTNSVNQVYAYIREMAYWNVKLSNANLQLVTT